MSFYNKDYSGINFNKVFNEEKPLIQKCIETITYDEILTETLERTILDIEQSFNDNYDCSHKIQIIIDTLDSKTYIEDVLSKANDEEKELVNKLKESLVLLLTLSEAEKLPDKYEVISEKYNTKLEPKNIPNMSKDHIERYEKMYSKEIDKKNFNKLI